MYIANCRRLNDAHIKFNDNYEMNLYNAIIFQSGQICSNLSFGSDFNDIPNT